MEKTALNLGKWHSNFAGRCLLSSLMLMLSQHALAHRTYNISGFSGILDPAYTFSGQDGLGLPNPTYGGGSGPNSTTTGQSFYNGQLPVSWMTALHEVADTAGEVFDLSTADALAASASTPANFVLGAGGTANGTGFDFGYIRVDHPQSQNGHGVRVTVRADPALNSSLKPYLALYAGWDHSWVGADGTVKTAAGGSTANRASAYLPGNNPLGSDLQLVAEAKNEAGLDSVTLYFTAGALEGLASAHFTLFVGGVGGTQGAYRASVETAAVPLPGTGLLFGSALTALGARRRQHRMEKTKQ